MMPLDDFLKNPKLTDPAWYKLDDFFPGLIAANRWNGKFAGGMGEGPLWSIPVMSESYILAYRKDIFDQHKIKVPRTYEEMAEAARQVKQKAGIDGLVARGTANFPTIATGYLSGVKSYTDGKWAELDEKMNAQFTDPAGGQVQPDLDRHAPRERAGQLGQHDLVRRDGDLRRRPGGHVSRTATSSPRPTRIPKKSKVAGKVGYALLPAGPGGTTYSGLVHLGAGHEQGDQEQGGGLAVHPVGDVAADAAQRHGGVQELQSDPPLGDERSLGPRRSWAAGGTASYLKTVQENLKTARVAWVPEPERPGWATPGRAPCTRSISSG